MFWVSFVNLHFCEFAGMCGGVFKNTEISTKEIWYYAILLIIQNI